MTEERYTTIPPKHIDMVIEHLFVGSMDTAYEASKHDFTIICVVDKFHNLPLLPGTKHIPITKINRYGRIEASITGLNRVALLIDDNLKKGKDILVHCGAGMERGPLAVMWYLHIFHKMTLDDAYNKVSRAHSDTMYRINWIPLKFRGEEDG